MAKNTLDPVLRHLRKLAGDGEALGKADHELLRAFHAHGDQGAFAAIVRRHADLVFRVCRNVLGHEQDAEDSFQATFLVLARDAASIRKPWALASWLHGVAHRMAMRAKREAGRRRARERKAPAAAARDALAEMTWREAQAAVDEEVQRLPERYRAPFVLCLLEGKGRAEAARELGLKEGTVWSRLSQARKLLQENLSRRGISLSAVLSAAAICEGVSQAAPGPQVATAARAAGRTTASSARAAALAEGMVTTMICGKATTVALCLVALGLVAAGAALGMPGVAPRGAGERGADPPAAPGRTGGNLPRKTTAPRPATALSGRPWGSGAAPHAPAGKAPHADRYGDPLPEGAVARVGTVRFRHPEGVECVAFLPGGRLLASAAGDTVYLWEMATGKERGRLQAPAEKAAKPTGTPPDPSPVRALACSPDGAVLASGDIDGTVRVWDVASQGLTRRWRAHAGPAQGAGNITPAGILELVFIDRKTLVSAGGDKILRVWDVATGKEVRQLAGPGGWARRLCVSPDRKLLAAAVWPGGEVRGWDLATGKEVRRLGTRPANCLAFSPDGKLLAAGAGYRAGPSAVTLWQVATARELARLDGGQAGLSAVSFTPDGNTLRSIGNDGMVRSWDMPGGKEVRKVKVPLPLVPQWSAFSPDGKAFLYYGDNSLRLRDIASGEEQPLYNGSVGRLWSVDYSPDGKRVLTADHSGFRVWDAATGREVPLPHAPAYRPGGPCRFSPDGKEIVHFGGPLCRWDAATGQQLGQLEVRVKEQTWWMNALSGDVRTLAVLDRQGGAVHLWDLAGAKKARVIAGHPLIGQLALSPDGRTLAATCSGHLNVDGVGEHLLHLWNTATGMALHRLEPAGKHQLFAACFSPDGKTLASCGADLVPQGPQPRRQVWEPAVKLWEVNTGRLRLRVKTGNYITGLAFAPNGRILAVFNAGLVGTDRERRTNHTAVRLLDAFTGRELHRLEGHRGAVTAVAFSPDGARLITGSADTTGLVWAIPEPVRRGERAGRLQPEELQALWGRLADSDAAAAYKALGRLAAAQQAVSFLERRLRASLLRPSKEADGLVADLGSARFARRVTAEKGLANLGDAAEGSLRKALARDPPLEVRRRIEGLLGKCGGARNVRALRAVEILERVGTPGARAVLEGVSELAPDTAVAGEATAAARRLRVRRPAD